MMRRPALAAVLIGLAAAACGGTGGGQGSGPPPSDGVHYRWAAADCIAVESRADLPAEPFGSSFVVGCGEEHAFEVILAEDLPEGDAVPYPDDLAEESRDACADAFRDYVGAHLSETGLDLLVYRPSRADWAAGLRYRTCLVQDPRGGGDLPLVTGSLEGAGSSVPSTVAAGQCFAGRSVLGPPSDCDAPHLAEAIGPFTHPEDGAAPWPGADLVRAATDAGCAAVLGTYAVPGSGTVPADPVAFARPLTRPEWEDGLRTVPCAVLVFDSDHRHVEVVGSLAVPGWRVVSAGQAA